VLRTCITAPDGDPMPGMNPSETRSVSRLLPTAPPNLSVRRAAGRAAHLFTVDVEEYFHAAALERVAEQGRWGGMESRVEASVDLLLEALERHEARGTFFTLGWLAARRPGLVRRIAEAGHEVASHGWSHRRVTALWPNDFREEARRSKDALEDACGQPVLGFRAPNFSLVRGWEWAFDILLAEGYAYDSSVFPGRTGHPADAPTAPYAVERTVGTLWEVPLASARFGPARVPAAGGAYFRLFPYALTLRALRQAEARGEPAVFYLHPWEIDPGQPRLPVGPLTRVRHYGGLRSTSAKLERLLDEFRFTSVAAALGLEAGAPALAAAEGA
jgi:polysaccharide deacetylase family protein (PEP-CTERM system associated)